MAGDEADSTDTVVQATQRRVRGPSGEEVEPVFPRGSRYRPAEVLGRGGMGEIHLAHDDRIGRLVALKVMLDSVASPDGRARFLREAQVQGQLEHPAIVPVYDLDCDSDGLSYFVMKRIAGVTLGQVLERLRRGDAETRAKYSLRRMLAAFQQLCLAVDYAHARGVIHRDLKPANVMLGDFGEVYLLDWGIAKVADGEEVVLATGERERALCESDSTNAGEILGTVGCMAPEQMLGEDTVDHRADIYSLGALLFQILTLEPLHGRGTVQERARSTQLGADARASRRAPTRGLPPELDAVCGKATALLPRDRYQSARALHDDIDRFLDGDRDLRLRAEITAQHLATAREAARAAFEGEADATEHRAIAIREAGLAVALDPTCEDAAVILSRLMLEPPEETPKEVRKETQALFEGDVRRTATIGAFVLLGFAASPLLLAWTGVRSWELLALLIAPLILAAGYAWFLGQRAKDVFELRHTLTLSALICTSLAVSSAIAGPLLFTPIYALAFAVVMTVQHGLGRGRYIVIGMACASIAVPALAEWIGLVPSSYRFEDGVMTIIPRISELPSHPVRGALLVVNLGTILLVCALLWSVCATIAKSREQVQLHAWHLDQLLPKPKKAPRDGSEETRRTRVPYE